MFERFTRAGHYRRLKDTPLPYGVMAHMLLGANRTLESSSVDSPLRRPEQDMYLRRLANHLIDLFNAQQVVDEAFAGVEHDQPRALPMVSIVDLSRTVLDAMDQEHIAMEGVRSPLVVYADHIHVELAMVDAYTEWIRQQPIT